MRGPGSLGAEKKGRTTFERRSVAVVIFGMPLHLNAFVPSDTSRRGFHIPKKIHPRNRNRELAFFALGLVSSAFLLIVCPP
ncbi:hypothetical protein F4775DRAFT_538679 [Biscogniauxia sp. FL1348]|nr:hypothetical protein F4775DRAFT_538679 [Biscogniauxia sp. FL1348]